MNFKDIIATDLENAFANEQEFWERHTINGKDMLVMLSHDEYRSRKASKEGVHFTGIYTADTILHVLAKDYGSRPANGTVLLMDGKVRFTVLKSSEAGGMYKIELERNKALGR